MKFQREVIFNVFPETFLKWTAPDLTGVILHWLTLNVPGTELSRFKYVNIMAADALAPYVARTSAAMILTM